MIKSFFLIALVFLITSCSTNPQPFVINTDNCVVCKMAMADLRFGGEIITKKGKIYKFDDIGCMISFLKSASLEEKVIDKILVMNFEKQNEFIEVLSAWFLVSPEINSPMKSDIAGFENKEAAEKIKKGKEGEIINWDNLLQTIK